MGEVAAVDVVVVVLIFGGILLDDDVLSCKYENFKKSAPKKFVKSNKLISPKFKTLISRNIFLPKIHLFLQSNITYTIYRRGFSILW